jgi:putative membrane protein
MTRAHRWTLVAFLVVLAATWLRPTYPAEQAMHHSLTVLGLVALLLVQRRRPLPYPSFLLIVVFLTLHTVAARWIYSFVPYDDWIDGLFGFRPADVFGWQRNHFDRLVHLAYGLCFGPVIFRAFVDAWPRRRRGLSALIAVDVVLSTSALYELFEWGIAVSLGAGAAEAYNGQQGDPWDAHRDMALATLGAIAGIAIAAARTRRRSPDASAGD